MISGGDFALCTSSAPTAAIALTSAAVIMLPITVIAFAERRWMGALFFVDQAWRAVAASLSWGHVAKGGT